MATGFTIGGSTPSSVLVGSNNCNLIKMDDIGVWNSYPMSNSGATVTDVADPFDNYITMSGYRSYVEAITTMGSAVNNPCSCSLITKLQITGSDNIIATLTHFHLTPPSAGQVNYATLKLEGVITSTQDIRIPDSAYLSNSSKFFVRMYICNSINNVPGWVAPHPFMLYADCGWRDSSSSEIVHTYRTNILYDGDSGGLCENPIIQYKRVNETGTPASNISCTLKTVQIR